MHKILLNDIKNDILLHRNSEYQLFENLIDFLEYKDSKSFKLLHRHKKNAKVDAMYEVENNPIIFLKKLKHIDENKIIEIHKEMWNLNQAPIGILVLPNEIRIYNNYIPPENDDKFLFPIINADNIDNIDNLVHLSENEIRSGNIFTVLTKKFAKANRVDKHLLANLNVARTKLHKNSNMPYDLAHNLLARSIFVKYLEDRRMVTANTFNKYGVSNFTELLGRLDVEILYDFFDELKRRFNGDLFKISSYEKLCVNSYQIDIVYNFFMGTKLSTGQLSMFPYDFSIIPVELISNIYETFLNISNKENKANSGIFYTPYFLADFVLSYSLDNIIEERKTYELKVLDPACGSGIFLVESFRRLVNKYMETRNIADPKDLINILKSCIFGIDLSEEAIQISTFSLYIALLDYIEPKDIEMNNIRFPNLIGNNLFIADFFDEDAKFNKFTFDVIVGNPPWASSRGNLKALHEVYCQNSQIPISDRQIAYSFMARVKDFSHEDTLVTLIVTSKFLYNHTASKFRTYILENFSLQFIIELSLCRDIIFDSATGPSAIISYKYNKNQTNDDSDITYHSIKPNIFTKLLKKIVIDPSEIIEVKQCEFKKRDNLWKILLFGNMFDSYLIKRLQEYKTFQELSPEYGLVFGQGFKKGKPKHNYNQLLNKKFINTKKNENYLYRYFVDFKNAPKLQDIYLECPGKFEVYEAPHLLIKRGMSSDNRCVCSTLLEEAVFTNSVNAVTGKNDLRTIELFYYLEGILNSKLYSYYHFHTSSSWAVERDEVLIKEHKEAPIIFPQDNELLSKKLIEIVCKIKCEIEKLNENNRIILSKDLFADTSDIESQIEKSKHKIKKMQDEIDKIVYELYDIDELEQDVIENTHDVSIDIFRKGHKSSALKPVTKEELKEYVLIFLEHFNCILKRDNKCIQAIVYQSKNFFVAVNFKVMQLSEDYDKIEFKTNFDGNYLEVFGVSSIDEISYDVYINRKIRGFSEKSFYIIKTNEKKNWTKVNARVDLNDFMRDMFSMEGGL